MSEFPTGTIGYGAVVIPAIDEFQGFYIVDAEAFRREAVLMQMTAMAAQPSGVVGALQSVIVEAVVTKNWSLAGIVALGLHGITKEPFFWIKASREPGGTRTEMFPLVARSVQAAKIEANGLPLVQEIKARLRVDMVKRKQ